MMVNEEFKNGKEVYCTNGGKTMPLTTHDWEWFILVYTTNCDNLGDGLLLFCPHDTIVMYYVLLLVVLYK